VAEDKLQAQQNKAVRARFGITALPLGDTLIIKLSKLEYS
jgi:hypothetical protein